MKCKLETRGEAGRVGFPDIQMRDNVGVNQQAVKNRQKKGISETPLGDKCEKG